VDERNSNPARRRLLRIATGALGLFGGIVASVPFIRSMSPSARARAGGSPVTIDLSTVRARQQVPVIWRGKPIWVLHRDDAMLKFLSGEELISSLSDPDSLTESQQPDYARNPHRSIRPEYFVAIGLCTHLGCVPSFRPDVGSMESSEPWPGGYFCPCHGSKFDLAGRVYRNVPAPTNLVIPPHRYISESVIEVG
jgi:ubiquinol-cytochrome c reductase iron-sulfur subunit